MSMDLVKSKWTDYFTIFFLKNNVIIAVPYRPRPPGPPSNEHELFSSIDSIYGKLRFFKVYLYIFIYIYIYKREKGVGRRGVESGRARDWRELNFTAKSNCFPIANELGRQQMDRRSYLVFNACSLIDSKKFWFLFEICDCPPADASDKLLFFFVVHFCSVAVCVCQRVCQCVRYPIFKHLQNVKWRNSDEIWTSLSASLNRRTLVQSQFLANFVRIIYLVAVVVAVVFALIFCFVLKSREICLGFNGKQTPIRECV